jgi:hypothetical protein
MLLTRFFLTHQDGRYTTNQSFGQALGASIQMLMSWAARGVYANPCTEGQVQARNSAPCETHRLDVRSGTDRKTISGGL